MTNTRRVHLEGHQTDYLSSKTVSAAETNDGYLPRWPLTLGFIGYPFWWVTGVGDMVWPLVSIPMVFYLLRRRSVTVPRGFVLWALFLFGVAFSITQIDTGGRLIGYAYRLLLYVAATTGFVYVYNARRELTARYLAGTLTCFWMIVVFGGYLGVLFPLLSIRTPMAYLLPSSILDNELVREMAIRRVTQYNPQAWSVIEPRPSAPFLYTNSWGNVYSTLTPVVVAYLMIIRRTEPKRFWMLLVLLPASLVPALLTLNRGMLIGLAAAALYLALRAFLARDLKLLGTLLTAVVVGTVIFSVLPVQERLNDRLESSSTTRDRENLYEETLTRTMESPILGFGAPRPSATVGAPSAGTQGQVWMVLFSHGFPAVLFFLSWFIYAFIRSLQYPSGVQLAASSALLVTLVEVFYYGIVGTGLVIILLLTGLVLRPNPA